ncbi:helix-turn-helix domain-containing protein [Streptosporangium sp. DT93]|uniref:helix-turn-helix domain-containing protein n=1 Tax=Streptosporangium sp. DT93 TaxID=3393428 RepID=UPI003CE99945
MASSIQVTTREAAAAHGVSLRTAQRWCATGKLAAAKDTAGRWVITLTADVADFKAAQLDRARELIEQGGILPTRRPGIYTAVSSDGSARYLVHRCGCSCPSGARGKHLCYHRAAVALVQAVGRAA